MILLYLIGCFLVSLSGVVGHGSNLITDYERSAIIEATHMVDGYYSWMTTHGKCSCLNYQQRKVMPLQPTENVHVLTINRER